MNKSIIKMSLDQIPAGELKNRQSSYIKFCPPGRMSVFEAMKSKELEENQDELQELIPEIIQKAQLTGSDKSQFVQNPVAPVPVLFITGNLLKDSQGRAFDITVQVGSKAEEAAGSAQTDDQRMATAAKRLSFEALSKQNNRKNRRAA